MKNLPIVDATQCRTLATPNESKVYPPTTLAIETFSDFDQIAPLYVEPSYPVDQAMSLFTQLKCPLLLVARQNQLIGVVSMQSLNNQELIKMAAEGFRRSELTVSDFIQDQPIAIEYSDFANATLDEIMRLMIDKEQDYCLVVKSQLGLVRGVLSAKEIARLMGLERPKYVQGPNVIKLAGQIYRQTHQEKQVLGIDQV